MRPTVAFACSSGGALRRDPLLSRAGLEDLELFLRLGDFTLRDAELRALLIERLTTHERLLGERSEALHVALREIALVGGDGENGTGVRDLFPPRTGDKLGQAGFCGGYLSTRDFTLRGELGLLEAGELIACDYLIAFANRDGVETTGDLEAQLCLGCLDGSRGDDGAVAIGGGHGTVDGERADGRKDDAANNDARCFMHGGFVFRRECVPTVGAWCSLRRC